jgi:hypothetical protein
MFRQTPNSQTMVINRMKITMQHEHYRAKFYDINKISKSSSKHFLNMSIGSICIVLQRSSANLLFARGNHMLA